MSIDFFTRHKTFFGWRMVAFAAITGAMTGPGQTIGVSVFIDHFIDDLGISRSEVSTAYLVGTLGAALVLPLIGNRIDRIGVRRAMTMIAIAFGIALVGMAGVDGLIALVVGFFAIRLFGQGSLSLASTLAVTHWFDRKRGLALGIMATAMGILMSLVPVLLNVVIEAYSWRTAWIVAAVLVWVIVIPIAQWGLIDRPSDVGQYPDGVAPNADDESTVVVAPSATRGEAIKTSRFWIVVVSSSTVGLLSTALNFHQISMLGDAGLSATEAAAMFLPQVIGAAVSGVIFGYLADRLPGRVLIPMAMGILAVSLLLTLVLAPGTTVILYAISLGAAGGSSRTVTSTLLPRWFGVGHIGAIQGTATLVGVASTALGPVMFSIAKDVTGSYGVAAAWFALIPVAVAIVATTMKPVSLDTRHADAA
ncbi:MAG: MFS transporter [Actinomycetia bacterium]|nr:MFS transporter [Actinomycetes bacterium]